jgi:DNA-binding MarR family transcriptional regulator
MARSQEEYTRPILEAIASGEPLTQRSLSQRLGVALGLTNLLIRRLVSKGYVRVSHMGTRHVRYFMTNEGLDALAKATRQSLANTVHLYTQTREQIRYSLALVSRECPIDERGEKRIVFYGAGDVAEIAYVSLQSTDLQLVGVVDDKRTGRFFTMPIRHSAELTPTDLAGEPYSFVVVTSLRYVDAIRSQAEGRGIAPSRVWDI